MNIHEYQAKAVLKEFGVPVPRGIPVLRAADAVAAAEALGGPVWVVKSQIHAGGRGKGKFKEKEAGGKGGVRLAKSVAEAEAFAGEMLGRTLVTAQTGPAGKQVNRVYLEDGANIVKEFYLSLLVDRSVSRVAFVVSTGAAWTSRKSRVTRRTGSLVSRSIRRPGSCRTTAGRSPTCSALPAASPNRRKN